MRMTFNSTNMGFIDKSGRLVVPYQWKEAYNFSEGLARVEDDMRHMHLIDKKGQLVQ